MADIDTAAEARGGARRWLEANPEKIDAVEVWVQMMQKEARAAPNPWVWFKANSENKRLGDEAQQLGGPRSLVILIEDGGFGKFPNSGGTLSYARYRLAHELNK